MPTPPTAAFQVETNVDEDLEDLLSTEVDEENTKSKGYARYYTHLDSDGGICYKLCAYTRLFLITYTRFSKCFFLVLFGTILYSVASFLTNESESIGVVSYHMSNIHSEYDFDLGKIDHWCLNGRDDGCDCDDPLNPIPKVYDGWIKDHVKRVESIKAIENLDKRRVVFLGQSITAIWSGDLGLNRFGSGNKFTTRASDVFKSDFSDSAIAIGGVDNSCANILWNLNRGLLSNEDLQPDVWWLVLGMEDLAKFECSEEVTIMGVLRIVEELIKKKAISKDCHKQFITHVSYDGSSS